MIESCLLVLLLLGLGAMKQVAEHLHNAIVAMKEHAYQNHGRICPCPRETCTVPTKTDSRHSLYQFSHYGTAEICLEETSNTMIVPASNIPRQIQHYNSSTECPKSKPNT